MKARIERMSRRGRQADAGFGTMDLIIWLAVVALIVGAGVGLYFILMGNANENRGQDAGLAAHNAVQSYYADYGTVPADATAVDAYLEAAGDAPAASNAPNGTTIIIIDDPDGTLPTNAVMTVVTSTEFSDVIVIDRTGNVTKFPTGDTAIPDTSVPLMQWAKDDAGAVVTS